VFRKIKGKTRKSKKRGGEGEDKNDSSPTGILDLIEKSGVRLFHTPGGIPFVSFYSKNHWENWPVKSSIFETWLSAMCYHHNGAVPSQKSIAEAKNTLAGQAQFSSREEKVHIRLASHDDSIYLDLCNESWEVVKISSDGWGISAQSPVNFYRAPGMLPLPHPLRGGTIGELLPFLNMRDQDQEKLVVSWLVASLRPTGPFPVLILEGMHGSGKSTTARVLRSLFDPNQAPLRGEPPSEQDLAISAHNAWCLGLDNLSSIKGWTSDALCRLSTGGGFSTRQLYTDDGEKIFQAMRPVLITAIDIGDTREDLLDRALTIVLPEISPEDRETEEEFWTKFGPVRPQVLGCLLDAVSCALRRLRGIKLTRKPRMADFAVWVTAAEPALGWPDKSILEAYYRNRAQLNALALESSSLYKPIVGIVERGQWNGTPSEFLAALRQEQLEVVPLFEQQPLARSPRELSQLLRRLAPNLAQAGIIVEFGRTAGSNSVRTITIKKIVETGRG
jgi:hypothetical protein